MQKQEVSLSVSSPHCVLKNFQTSSSLATEEDTNQRQRLTFPHPDYSSLCIWKLPTLPRHCRVREISVFPRLLKLGV
ncbi:hypothetical protein NDI49_10215 [Trichocoleus sp. ST-U3]